MPGPYSNQLLSHAKYSQSTQPHHYAWKRCIRDEEASAYSDRCQVALKPSLTDDKVVQGNVLPSSFQKPVASLAKVQTSRKASHASRFIWALRACPPMRCFWEG